MKRRIALAVIGLLLLWAATGGLYYYLMAQRRLPPGFASGNGRIEANEIDIATKYAARIASIEVDEGDLVKAGQILAHLDTRELEAQLRGAEAQVVQASRARDEAAAVISQRRSEAVFAEKEYDRYLTLLD